MQGQTQISLKDKATKLPIAYANIWKEKQLYRSSDSTGVFKVEQADIGMEFKITCVGYNDAVLKMSEVLTLEPNAIELNEVKVTKRKFEKTVKLGKAKRGDSAYAVQYDAKNGMSAKFFENTNNTTYINTVKFCASASERNRIISLLFYTVGENGQPKEIINTETIIVKIKKGTHVAEVDVSKLSIEFPKEGVFVAIQHLLLEQNKEYTKPYRPNAFFYEPTIAVDLTKEYKDTWYFKEDTWHKNNGFSVNMQIIGSD
ncbi:MAG: hypothetical protein RL427_1152 [Bacteroidota bacterium]|jgi:hypothetical protein